MMNKKTITHKSGRQVVTADADAVKAAMKPKTAKTVNRKQDVKNEVYEFGLTGYHKILPYFSMANPHYKVAAKYMGPEDFLHVAICTYIREYHPTFKVSHPKNESKEGFSGQCKKKLMAVNSGFSDLLIQRPDTLRDLYLEVKVKPNKATPEQLEFIEFQRGRGHSALHSIIQFAVIFSFIVFLFLPRRRGKAAGR